MAEQVALASLDAVVARLKAARRVAVLTHQRPDPDALGSQAGMAMILKKAGAQRVVVVNWEAPPRHYAFLQEGLGGIEVVTFGPAFEAEVKQGLFDTLLVVDTCTYQQMEPGAGMLKANSEKVVAIDHHLSRDAIGPAILADTTAAACAEIAAGVARAMGVALDKEIATRLMAGLVGDTGWFRFDSVTARSHRVAAELVAAGAEPAALYERLQQNETPPKLALMARALGSIVWGAGGKVALMVLRQADFAATGATGSQTEELVNVPLMVGSVEVSGLLTQMPDGKVRASLRSKHAVDVNAICKGFGGGGHAKAAGCRLEGPVEEAVRKVMAAVEGAVGI